MLAKASGFGIAAIAACLFATGVEAGQYEFLAAPQINLSLVYRLDKLTGDVIACQFAHNPGRTDVGPARSASRPAIAAVTARQSRSPATMGSWRRVTSRKAACFASIIAPARSAFAISIFSARSRAITKRLRTSMSYARRRGSRRPPPPRIQAARSANCQPPVQRETDALQPLVGRLARSLILRRRAFSGASKNGPIEQSLIERSPVRARHCERSEAIQRDVGA